MKKILVLITSLLMIVVIAVSGFSALKGLLNEEWENPLTRFDSMSKSYYLDVVAEGNGSISDFKSTYVEGSMVSIEASADENNFFSGWYTAEGSYITSSPVYTFMISEDTDLVARFFEQYDELKGSSETRNNVKNVEEDFKFEITCEEENAKEYLKEKLVIVDSQFVNTEFENLAKVEFEIQETDKANVYVVSPVENVSYEKGITYTAKISEEPETEGDENTEEIPETEVGEEVETPEEEVEEEPEEEEEEDEEDDWFGSRSNKSKTYKAQISLNNSEELEFTVEKEDVDVQTLDDSIVYIAYSDVDSIVDDGLIKGEDGDREDYIVTSCDSLSEGRLFCVYGGGSDAYGNPELDEDSFFGKVSKIDGSKIFYDAPSLTEVYSKLEIFYSKEADLSGAELAEGVSEAIRKAVIEDEEFKDFITVSQLALKNTLGDGYETELLAKENQKDNLVINVTPRISQNKVKVKITASLITPVTDKNGNSFNAVVNMTVDKNITLSKHVDIRTRDVSWVSGNISYFDFSVGVSDEESAVINLLFDENATNTISLSLVNEIFANEFNKLARNKKSDKLVKNGASKQSSSGVRLFRVSYKEGSVGIDMSVDFNLNLDIGGTAYLVSNTKNEMEVGIRSEGVNGAVPYANAYSESSLSNCTVVGTNSITSALGVKAEFTLDGFKKYVNTSFDFSSGSYYNLNGLVNTNTSHFAGKVQAGSVYSVAGLDYKVFENRGNWSMKSSKKEHYSYGTGKAILSYVNNADLVAGKGALSFLNGSIDLLKQNILAVNVLNTETYEITTDYLDANCKDYDVDVKPGKNLNYNKGELSTKNNAPEYFKSTATVKVKPKTGSKSTYSKNGYTLDLPTVTLNVVYGDEDSYYDSIDTELQKQFRILYRNYNDANAGMLHRNFENLTTNIISLPREYRGLVDLIIYEYVDKLFVTVTDYRAKDDSERTMENKFVIDEAAAFEHLADFVNSIVEDKEIDSSLIDDLVEHIALSKAMSDTIITVSKSDDAAIFSELYQTAYKGTREMIDDALDELISSSKENGIPQVANAFKKMFK